MEAIAKKMQAMKVEKDNAMDDADVWEEKARAMKVISFYVVSFYSVFSVSSSHNLFYS